MIKKCCVCGRDMKVFAKGESYTYWRCSQCHWFSTSANVEVNEFNYDDYETFDADLSKRAAQVEEAKNMLLYKFSLLNMIPSSFLDIGCSEGIFVEAYNHIMGSNEAYGIEVAAPKIQRAQNMGLKVYSFENMPLKTFDFVLCRHVIEHVDSPVEYLQSILKYIGKGGTLCIETPNNENYDNLKNGNTVREDRFCRDLYPPTHVCGFTPRTFRKIAKVLNLDVIKLMTHDVGNTCWCYADGGSGKLPLKNKILEKMHLGSNIAVFLRLN